MGTQYLTFTLNDSLYAVEVLQVREVLEYTPPQELPCPDPVIAGLIRSRGQSISVINLRHKFGFEDVPPSSDTRIIVLEVPSNSAFCNEKGQMVFGAIADSVNEVLDLNANSEEHTPEVGHSLAAEFISGIGSVDGKFIIILDMDKVLSFEEQEKIAPTTAEHLAKEEE